MTFNSGNSAQLNLRRYSHCMRCVSCNQSFVVNTCELTNRDCDQSMSDSQSFNWLIGRRWINPSIKKQPNNQTNDQLAKDPPPHHRLNYSPFSLVALRTTASLPHITWRVLNRRFKARCQVQCLKAEVLVSIHKRMESRNHCRHSRQKDFPARTRTTSQAQAAAAFLFPANRLLSKRSSRIFGCCRAYR